jgi:hypothetical protein
MLSMSRRLMHQRLRTTTTTETPRTMLASRGTNEAVSRTIGNKGRTILEIITIERSPAPVPPESLGQIAQHREFSLHRCAHSLIRVQYQWRARVFAEAVNDYSE